ncbi:MAG: AmmeMemoRadiSam system protein A [Planctomycetes bacterium]|nr:AmmeMemoRadiSam system protein A [Planctomycetota bacterium]
MPSTIAPADQRLLFDLVRETIRRLGTGRPAPTPQTRDDDLRAVRGLFVTLRRGEELRGCVGHAVGRLPLIEAARTLAASAARDRRFAPVAPDEVAALTVELSVLSPLVRARLEEVVVGRHGVVLRLGDRSGLLLPQVAAERGWDARALVEHACRKAGLEPDAWRLAAARLSTFTCDVYVDLPRAASA